VRKDQEHWRTIGPQMVRDWMKELEQEASAAKHGTRVIQTKTSRVAQSVQPARNHPRVRRAIDLFRARAERLREECGDPEPPYIAPILDALRVLHGRLLSVNSDPWSVHLDAFRAEVDKHLPNSAHPSP
jgi:hypothetical protein